MALHDYDYLLNIETIGNGTVVSTKNQGYQQKGGLVTLKAIPNSGARFVKWQGDATGTHHVCNLRISSPTTVVAVFVQIDNLPSDQETLTVQKNKIFPVINDSTPSLAPIQDPFGRFVIYVDGTIVDLNTGLTWMIKTFSNISYADVYAGERTAFQRDGWRLPSMDELKNIINLKDNSYFKIARGYYWSCEIEKFGEFINWSKIISSSGSMGHGNLLMGSNHVKLVKTPDFFPIESATSGDGSGIVSYKVLSGANYYNSKPNEYIIGSDIQCTAISGNGSIFKRWHGDLEGTENTCVIKIDGPKSIFAEFELIHYPLTLKTSGSGVGAIHPSIQADAYPHGTVLALTAMAAAGSKFKQWGGDAQGTSSATTVTIDSAKFVTAEFVQFHPLSVSTIGQGKGSVQRSVQADSYEMGSTVTLTAIPAEGHLFVGWQGDASGQHSICKIQMDAAKAVTAKFVPKPLFDVTVACVGTGSGAVLPASQTHWQGSVIERVAKAAIGSVFDGWEGDASGFEPRCSVTVNAHLAITARFSRVDIADTEVSVAFDGVTSSTSADGTAGVVLLFTVANRSARQIQIDLPPAGYVTLQGEEVAQHSWVKGMIDGEQGATLRAGTFRKLGLAFDLHRLPTLQAGEHLHLTLRQSKPALLQHMVFRCTDSLSREFALVKASVEQVAPAPAQEESAEPAAAAAWASRMQQMEQEMQETLRKLKAAAEAAAAVAATAAPQPSPQPLPAAAPPATSQSLLEVLAWLCTQNHVPLAVLRQKLLPLDLMPSAVIDDVNERAFDVAGEAALDEAEDAVTVQRAVLLQVLAAW